jgi:hypothetical protein
MLCGMALSHASRFSHHRAGATAIAAAATLLGLTLTVRANQAPPQAGAPAAKPLVPMTASSILRNPAAHVGENLAKTAFTVDQDKSKSTGKDLLVLAPTLTASPELNTYLTIEGEVARFDRAEIDRKSPKYLQDVPADVIAKYQGQPVVLATAVITTALVDLAKHVPPPMTPAELGFRQLMLTISPANNTLRAGLDQPNAATALKDQAAALKKSFIDVQAYFGTHGPAGAEKFAGDALALATTIDASLAAGKIDDAKTAATNLQQFCTNCHGQFRERQDDGSYRIKSGG